MTELQQADMAMAYEEVKALLHYSVARFVRHYRQRACDVPDLYATARLAFVKAFHSYNPTRSGQGFPVWCSFKAWHEMQSDLRTRMKRKEEQWPDATGFDPEQDGKGNFLDGLSEDAKFVAGLVLGESPDLQLKLLSWGIRRKADAQTVREALMWLLREMEWEDKRIGRAVTEIKECMR